MIETDSISHRQKEIIEAAGKILTRSGVGGLTIKNLAKAMNFVSTQNVQSELKIYSW